MNKEEKENCNMPNGCAHGGGGVSTDDRQALQDLEIGGKLGKIAHKLLVMSGKGGVGKSSVAAYLSVLLARRGFSVGLMDVDLHGPSIPRMLGVTGRPQPSGENGIKPVECMPNLWVMSMETILPDKDAATIWRGPVKIGVIRQFISDVEWGNLDYLVIDSPPGTGDEPLTVAQTVTGAKAVVVTTPQEISLADVRKSINFCRQVGMDILGIVENMSGLVCPHCGQTFDLFKRDGGKKTAEAMGLRFLGSLPVEPGIVEDADGGALSVLNNPQSEYTRSINGIIDTVVELTEGASTAKGDFLPTQNGVPETGDASVNNEKVFAVPTASGMLCNHFGHCEQFAMVKVQDGKVTGKEMVTPPPHEPGLLPKWIAQQGARVVIAGGMGKRAQDLFTEQGIEVVVGAPSASPERLVEQYLEHSLQTGVNTCDH